MSSLFKALVFEEPKVAEPVRVNLACGQQKREGWIGVDITKTEEADVVHDLLTFPWPFEDNSVDEVECSHFIEHIPMEFIQYNGRRTDLLIAFFNELHRVMKPGGKAYFIAPFAFSTRFFQDPTHRRGIVPQLFLYFDQKWLKDNKLDHYASTADFDFNAHFGVNGNVASMPQTRSSGFLEFANAHYVNIVDDVHVYLTKRGSASKPGGGGVM